jgi:L-lactate dehydrogenase complex protein LldF
MNACPVFRELGGHAYNSIYPGPIGSVISAGLFGSEFVPLAQASSLCGACKDACPVDIDLPKLLTRVRAGDSPSPILAEESAVLRHTVEAGGGLSSISKIFLKPYARLATHPRLFGLSQKFASLGTSLLSSGGYVRLPAFTGWGYSKDLPRFAGKTFRERFQNGPRHPPEGHRDDVSKAKSPPNNVRDSPAAPLPQSDIKLVVRFIEELTKVNGQVIRATESEVTRKVIEFLHSRNIDHIHLEANILDEDILQKEGVTVSHERDAMIRVGVTKALCGLADTGSVLEADGDGDKLFASLLPEIHLAILREADIYPSLENAIHLIRGTKSSVFITGPSRTSDIEMSLTIGVHGPGEIIVLLMP